MQLTVKALQGRECSLQVPEDELVSTLKQLVSEKLNVPVRQQRLLFKGKALADGKRLSDYSIGPNSKLNLVVKPLEKVLLEEGEAQRLADSPPPQVWQLISKVLARHFSAADASRVLEQLQRDYERSLSRLTLDDIERWAHHHHSWHVPGSGQVLGTPHSLTWVCFHTLRRGEPAQQRHRR
ncbi:UBL4A isoform 2 [Pan troglodytes]|uniref:Ubiquitin-like protein 4A n=2 Tax=Homininae TaxID=207598 RepID=Q5HY81_HUMAN|nr:ubiquitin like 4A [Homo sapiens]PNI11916.1 UBL4A isoform 2 [Pan troglodytes]